jgi:Na+/melibiose symporter-like transporter
MTRPALHARQGLAYGLLGLPLAFVALPLYVQWPHYYAAQFGVPLATLGAVLLCARLLDAVIDPMLGRLSDALYARGQRWVLAVGAASALGLGAGLMGLFHPPGTDAQSLLIWAIILLVATYAAFSQLSISHQSWGAQLGGDETGRGLVVAWREGAGLVGVVLASLLPALAGIDAMLAVFFLTLCAGWIAWTQAPRPPPIDHARADTSSLWHPWRDRHFRRLLAVFVLNGIASAVPATLLLFFVQDRLRAPVSQQAVFLGLYFACAALSIPAWLRAVARWGLARSWLGGMLLAMGVFVGTARLGAGDGPWFMLVCGLSGLALGSDLTLPSALLAGVIQARDESGREGAYFGWWNFATKLNLALAAGLALPLLAQLGYEPGTSNEAGLQALTWVYAILPCVLKSLAAAALYVCLIWHQTLGAANRSEP